jgi:molybdate transport system substrate-binding protein
MTSRAPLRSPLAWVRLGLGGALGRRHLLIPIVAVSVALAACGDDGDSNGSASSDGEGVVHTVPQLEPVVRDLVDAYNEGSDAGVDVTVEPEQDAVQAASEGRAAVLPGPWLEDADTDSTAIGRNLAIIAVPAGNPEQVRDVTAFSPDSGLDTQVCGIDSPYGNLGSLVLERGGVQPDLAQVSTGCDADALARVASGDLDAALVFRGLVEVPEGVEIVNIPEDRNLVIDINYAPVTSDGAASAFGDFLASDIAKQILTQQGLLP